jgi:hypothetical protein
MYQSSKLPTVFWWLRKLFLVFTYIFQLFVLSQTSVAAVWFGPVQYLNFRNLELDFGFGSANFLNLGLDPRFRFNEVQFGFRLGSDRFEPNLLLIPQIPMLKKARTL